MVSCFIDPTSLSRDNFLIKKLLEDGLSVKYLGVRLARDIFLAIEDIGNFFPRFQHPILIQHGRLDRIISYRSSEIAFKKFGSPDKEIKLYAENYHELFSDLEKEQVISDTIQWVDTRLRKAEPFWMPTNLVTGLKKRDLFMNFSVVSSYGKIAFVVFYLLILRKLSKNPAYRQSRLKLLFFPVFWTYKYWEFVTKAGISQLESFLNQILVEFHLY